MLELLDRRRRGAPRRRQHARVGPASRERASFARRLAALTDRHRALWLARNRPGGLVDSVAWLDNLHAAYESGRPDPTWGGWPERFT